MIMMIRTYGLDTWLVDEVRGQLALARWNFRGVKKLPSAGNYTVQYMRCLDMWPSRQTSWRIGQFSANLPTVTVVISSQARNSITIKVIEAKFEIVMDDFHGKGAIREPTRKKESSSPYRKADTSIAIFDISFLVQFIHSKIYVVKS